MRTLDHEAAGAPARRPGARTGPGPSKLRYRLSRAWAKPGVRNLATVYVPLALLGLVGWRLAADDEIRMAAEARIAAVADRLAARPEFAVSGLRVEGASPALRRAIAGTVGLSPGTSSLKLDLDAIRARVEALGPVAGARLRFGPNGVLEIEVRERIARALWRGAEGRLALLDAEGVVIGTAKGRAEHPDLPLLLGPGAPARVGEALELIAAAPDLVPRIRALVLVGQRRWNIALSRDLTLMLPAARPGPSLRRIMALHRSEALLDRDLIAVDLRLADRPTLRLTERAMERYRARRAAAGEES